MNAPYFLTAAALRLKRTDSEIVNLRQYLLDKLSSTRYAYFYVFNLQPSYRSVELIEMMILLEITGDKRPILVSRMLGRLHSMRNTLERGEIRNIMGMELPK